MTFIDEKNDGACLPCEKQKKSLLDVISGIDEFKPILATRKDTVSPAYVYIQPVLLPDGKPDCRR